MEMGSSRLYDLRLAQLSHDYPHRIAITGSQRVVPNRAEKCIREIAAPYLPLRAQWWCGTNGTLDEVAADVLIDTQQVWIALGTSSTLVTPRMLQIIEKYDIPFVDAQREDLPDIGDAPSKRAYLFAYEATLTIIVWDGTSKYTSELIKWFSKMRKNHIIAFA